MSSSAEPAGLVAPRTRGPYRNGVASRARIVRAASEAFGEHGYHGASIRTIAAKVGTSPATLIQHFGSKEGLLEAVLVDWENQAVPPDPSRFRGLAYINELLRHAMPFHIEHRGLIELFLTMTAEATNAEHPARDFIQHRYARTLAQVAESIREAISDEEIMPMSEPVIEAEARLVFAVMDGIELQWLLDPSVDLVGLFDHYVEATTSRWRGATT